MNMKYEVHNTQYEMHAIHKTKKNKQIEPVLRAK